MSRFFATASDSETECSSEDEQIPRQPAAAYAFSDEEEETKRIVRSTKEKRYEELTNLIKQIKNFKKIKDMSSMLTGFEELMRAYSKALPVITIEESGNTPRFYLRCLVEMDDFINQVWDDKDGRKNMSKNNSKSLSILRQKLRKYKVSESESEAEDNTTFTKAVSDTATTETKSAKSQIQEEDAGSEDSTDWGSDSDSDSDSSEDDAQYTTIRERFLKRTTDKEEEEKKKKEKKERKEKERIKKTQREEEEDEGEWETVKGGVAILSEKPKMFPKDAEIDVNVVVKKLNEIVAARGKKSTDRKEQIELLHELQAVADQHKLGAAVAVKIKFSIVTAIFDYNPRVSDAMKPEYWSKLLERVSELMDMLLAEKDIIIGEHILEENESFDKVPYKLRGCTLIMVERLDEEFIKLLKECDPHSNEYVERHANIKDAHNCLLDLMMTGKMKELLAQGLLPQRQNERSKEQEKVEKQRQMPFHMHINLELLECVYLVSAMLIEIPYMAAHEFDARRRMISKTFYQQLRASERQSLAGPPESMREHVVAASKALRNGNWKACKNFVINSKMNAKVWDLFHQADNVREMLTRLIQEEALRTYLFTYSHVYDSISMPILGEMFDLDRAVVHSIISKMIINEELMASLDDPTHTVVMHRSEPSRLQSLALQLSDKVINLVDSNERIFETKQGTVFNRGAQGFRDRQNFNRAGQDWNRQRQNRAY
ncbi:conserved hypothetical protein [Pediculus humanus corporis]|uniref:Eukaryotic translation initiation factor 3 subunit C n=1 Tax=Pediculus humanus subsp. corporis TaxID=121224 RepID=E0VMN2_PEDHC|nr:uncharacterized protein Phum_PHUM316120 [Pediculus humanus corporis]EEB14638.1 conserved hypothetical protein [Pediculus humanus corporis]